MLDGLSLDSIVGKIAYVGYMSDKVINWKVIEKNEHMFPYPSK
jgi:hypothetical protein